MIDQVHNETLKLIASWFNAASVAVIGGGTALPVIKYFYDRQTDPAAVWPDSGLLAVCICVGLGLHFLGQTFLGGLQRE